MKLSRLAAFAGAFSLLVPACTRQSDPVAVMVEQTLAKMTQEEKAGQMIQISIDQITKDKQLVPEALDYYIGKYKVGSFLNAMQTRASSTNEMAAVIRGIQEKSMEVMGIPCIYGLDQIHGATYLSDGTLFPQEINLAATFDTRFASAMGKSTAYETRAAQVPWTFSPVMDLGRDPRWSRHWESWGEDPYLQAEMSKAVVVALQGENPTQGIDDEHIAASIKHYMGYGVPATGKDRTPAYISISDLKDKFFRPFKESIEAGAQTVMVNSASINGMPMHANHELLTGWLKEGLDWDGFIITDWADVNNLFGREHIAADRKEALALAINAGVDMIMDPYDPTIADDIIELVKEGAIKQSRIDDAVRRILRVKFRLGLFDEPVTGKVYDRVGCDEFVDASRQAAIESEVLLKNEGGLLPLSKDTRLLVTGPNADSMRSLNGGWSYTWQGSFAEEFTERYNTIYEALKATFADVRLSKGVSYIEGGNWQDEDASGIDAAVRAAAGADVIVACIGENSYCETPGNMNDLTLSENQIDLVKALARTGKPIILVLNEGRPRIINAIEPLARAVVDVMLPSNYGGDALAKLLCGDENFSARLPYTYPKYVHSLHTYDYKVSEKVETMSGSYNYDAVMDVQWPFGTGLSYTTFEYSDLRVDKSEFGPDDVLELSVDVRNTGNRTGKEAVLVYSSDILATMVPDIRRLRAFTKVELAPGEKTTVCLSIPARDLAFVGAKGEWRLEEGDFRISTGGLSTMVRCSTTSIW